MTTVIQIEVAPVTTNELINDFFSEFSALSIGRNLNSVLCKALASDNEAFNDPNYRTEMVYTLNSVTEFINRLAVSSGKGILNE